MSQSSSAYRMLCCLCEHLRKCFDLMMKFMVYARAWALADAHWMKVGVCASSGDLRMMLRMARVSHSDSRRWR